MWIRYFLVLCLITLGVAGCGGSAPEASITTPTPQTSAPTALEAVQRQWLKPLPVVQVSDDEIRHETFGVRSASFTLEGDYKVTWTVRREGGDKYKCVYNATLHPEDWRGIRDWGDWDIQEPSRTALEKSQDDWRTASTHWKQVPLGRYYLVVNTGCVEWQVKMERQ